MKQIPANSNHDRTSAQRQAKRRALFNQMRDALYRIEDAETLATAKTIAREGREGVPEVNKATKKKPLAIPR